MRTPILATAIAMLVTMTFATCLMAETCYYDTNGWGMLSMDIDPESNDVAGSYFCGNGQISGFREGGVIMGEWWQVNAAGGFWLEQHDDGFSGEWVTNNGQIKDLFIGVLIRCDQ